MKSIIKYLNLCVLIVFSLFQKQELISQDFENTINFADIQYESGNLTTALKTYQRALFFSEGRKDFYLFKQIAQVSYLQKDYETAQKYFGLAYNLANSDSLKNKLLFDKASCQMLNKNFQFALIDLMSINTNSQIEQKRLDFYLATCYYGLEDFENAQLYFKNCIQLIDTIELSELFSKRKILTPSPKNARIMSMIIPGLGQVYSGDLKSGLNSLLLTSGLLTLCIKVAINYQIIDAVISVLPWYQRYYTGGYNKAEEIARIKRQQKRDKVYAKILKLVDNNTN